MKNKPPILANYTDGSIRTFIIVQQRLFRVVYTDYDIPRATVTRVINGDTKQFVGTRAIRDSPLLGPKFLHDLKLHLTLQDIFTSL